MSTQATTVERANALSDCQVARLRDQLRAKRCVLAWAKIGSSKSGQVRRIHARVATVTKGLIVSHYARSRSLCPNLVTHLLDLRGLRFEGCHEGLNFLLLLRDGRF
jgi:hypothetical protein